jgi:DinB superfamily
MDKMNKPAIIAALTESYTAFTEYMYQLTPEAFVFRFQEKWTAGQQLAHMVLCVKPLVQVFGMDTSQMAAQFGATDRPGRSYTALATEYRQKLSEGGKAPGRFVPEPVTPDEKDMLCETLTTLINSLCNRLDPFEESDLDRLRLPHPLLGDLSLREMLYNAIDHVQHHQAQSKACLNNR